MDASIMLETAKLFAAVIGVFGATWGLAYVARWLQSRGTNYNGTFVGTTYEYGQTWVEVAKGGGYRRYNLKVQYKMMPFGDKFWLMQEVWNQARLQVLEKNLGALVNIQFENCNYQLDMDLKVSL
jgi:hypothetical protein